MIRLFKHYIPNAVFLLGIIDFWLLVLAGELGWVVRAHQIGMDVGYTSDRLWPLLTFAVLVQTAMVSVGVYGSDALRSMRYATARLMVAVSLGIIALSVVYFLIPGHTLWRSNLFYAMVFSMVLLVGVRLVLAASSAPRHFVAVCWCWARASAPIACASWATGPKLASSSSAMSR